MSAGKGDSPRPVHGPTYRENHERIFRRHIEDQPAIREVIDGHEYLGEGGWHTVDQKEHELRDEND
jgi:hypothetical protein